MKLNLTIRDNKEAAAYLRGKAAVSPETFGRLPAELRARAFTVARVTDFDLLRDLLERIAEIPEGGNWREARKAIAAELSPYIEDATAARYKAELVLRTNGFQAYGAARYRQQQATAEALPYWQYLTVGDENVRDSHASLDGLVLPADDPFWSTHYPPWDYNCRCVVAAITREETARMEAEDADKELSERRVLNEKQLEDARAGRISRGLHGVADVRPPAERTGETGAYAWTPGRIAPDLRTFDERYDPRTAADFRKALERDQVQAPDGSIVTLREFLEAEV